ncbi:MAG: GGDEF domain-containing protein [Ruminococcus sp.]|nr:GGDEF domain-containing protein [Ruminococcus sp.]
MEKYEREIENKRIFQEKDEVLSYLAYYDRLTHMPDRHLFIENLDLQNKQCAVVCINLDDFRRINDNFGMTASDEFAVILIDNNTSQDIINFAGQVHSIFFEPINVDGKNEICFFSQAV